MDKKSVRTIADIAQIAGVSKSTVSRALSDSALISDRTKDRIRAIAREHNYRINQPARRLSLQQSNTIAFVTHGRNKDISVEDLFQLEMLGSISTALAAHHYDLLMITLDPNDIKCCDEYLNTGRVDGFILMTSTRKQYHIKTLLAMQAPFIIWGIPQPRQSYCSVTGDNARGGRLATEHLIQTGRKRIAFLGGPEDELEVQLRFKGYEASLHAAGIPRDDNLIVYGDFRTASGREAVARLLDRAPDLDAVFANGDLMAIGAMARLQELGYRVPEDIAVVGYDDLSIARHTQPPLTTIRQHLPEAGRLLVQNLIQYLQTGVVTNVSIPVDLVIRKST